MWPSYFCDTPHIMTENAPDIGKATKVIRDGGLVAMPTETVYGLAADACNDRAVAKIFEAKGRPQFNPLIIHVTGADMARRYVSFPTLAEKLANHFWPGALTIVLPRRKDSKVSRLVSAGLDTIAVRAPNHPTAQALIKLIDHPVAAPSANRSGSISPTRPEHVRDSLGGNVDLILDGGPCTVGVESTIVKVDDDMVTLLRPGGITCEDIERLLACPITIADNTDKIEAPGMMASHYAPNAQIRLNVTKPKGDEAFLGFGTNMIDSAYALTLSADGDLQEAAANLFDCLHKLDNIAEKHALNGIACAPIPKTGLGIAINDRLSRAAAPKGR